MTQTMIVIALGITLSILMAATAVICALNATKAKRGRITFIDANGEERQTNSRGNPRKAFCLRAGAVVSLLMVPAIIITTTVSVAKDLPSGLNVSAASQTTTVPIVTDAELVQAGTPDWVVAKTETEDVNFFALADAQGAIPDVCNFRLDELEMEYAYISQYYNRMCDNSMAEARLLAAQIYLSNEKRDKIPADLFALPLAMPQEWFDAGTMYEQTDTDLATLRTQKVVTTVDQKTIEEQWKELQEELAEMSADELNGFYQEQLDQRLLCSPQYLLAVASAMRDNELFMEHNAPLIEKFFRAVARWNEIKLEDFSADFQKNFDTEEEWEAFLEDFFHEPTEEEIKKGEIFHSDGDVMDQFMDELTKMPLGIDRCVQYDPEHVGDFRYLMVTDEVREFGIRFSVILRAMRNYGVATFTTTRNWITPELRAEDRLLEVEEADYQENVPDKNGKIQYAYQGWWKDFPRKDANATNRAYLGFNLVDGRVIEAEPTAKPIEANKTTEKTTTYVVTYRYLEQGTNTKLASANQVSYAPGATVPNRSAKTISGYTCVNPNAGASFTMPSGNKTITFYYVKDNPNPTPTPNPDPNPTPTPTPIPDGQGSKNPGASSENRDENDHGRGDNDDSGPGSSFVNSTEEAKNDTNYSEENAKREQQENAEKTEIASQGKGDSSGTGGEDHTVIDKTAPAENHQNNTPPPKEVTPPKQEEIFIEEHVTEYGVVEQTASDGAAQTNSAVIKEPD